MIIRRVQVTPFLQNSRLVIDEASKKFSIVDPGGDIDEVLRADPGKPYELTSIILTHGHLDHAGGVKQLVRKLAGRAGVEIIAHRAELPLLAQIRTSAAMFGLSESEFEDCLQPTRLVEDGDVIEIGTLKAEVLHVPGHSPGHIALYFPATDVLFEDHGSKPIKRRAPVALVGDVIFAGSIGRTDLPGGDHAMLINSIEEKLLRLPGETIVLSGHGPDTTIGHERETNPFLK